MITESGWWSFNHLEKYEFVNGKDYPIYEMEKMFETTNQECNFKGYKPTELGSWHLVVFQKW